MSEHTKTPWKAWPTDGTLWVGGEKGYTVEFEDGEDAVKAEVAVNNHERLVEALGKALEYIEQSPCDPDIYPEQLAAWGELTSLEPHKLLAQLEAGKGGE